MLIPRSIHQQCGGRNIPPRYRPWVASWKRHHPAWDYTLWTDESCARFVRSHYPDNFPLYESYDTDVKRYDAFRYFLMHGRGGLYVDLDFECLQPLDSMFATGVTCILGHEPELHATHPYNRERLIGNAIVASVPGHPFWEHVIEVMSSCRDGSVLQTTGPLMLQDAYESYAGDDVNIVPWTVFYPLVDFRNPDLGLDPAAIRRLERLSVEGGFPAESLSVHHWMGTWHPGGRNKRVRRFLLQLRMRLGLACHARAYHDTEHTSE